MGVLRMKRSQLFGARSVKDYVFLLFILPAMIWVIAFAIYPFFYSIYISFTNQTLLHPEQASFVFLQNYAELINDPAFWSSAFTSIIFTVSVVLGQFFFGFLLALLLTKKMRMTSIVRMSVMLPWVLPPIALSLVWAWVLRAGNLGLVNSVLLSFGIAPINWFGPEFALFSVTFITIWIGVPFSFMLEMASLQKIPAELYEAASVDGASSWHKLAHITLPMMKDTFRINLIMITISTIGYFDIIYAITNGGPLDRTEVLPLLMYHTAFKSQDMGKGAAIAVSMLLISALLTVVYLVIFKDRTGKRKPL